MTRHVLKCRPVDPTLHCIKHSSNRAFQFSDEFHFFRSFVDRLIVLFIFLGRVYVFVVNPALVKRGLNPKRG